jgi:hypothetical protein
MQRVPLVPRARAGPAKVKNGIFGGGGGGCNFAGLCLLTRGLFDPSFLAPVRSELST